MFRSVLVLMHRDKQMQKQFPPMTQLAYGSTWGGSIAMDGRKYTASLPNILW